MGSSVLERHPASPVLRGPAWCLAGPVPRYLGQGHRLGQLSDEALLEFGTLGVLGGRNMRKWRAQVSVVWRGQGMVDSENSQWLAGLRRRGRQETGGQAGLELGGGKKRRGKTLSPGEKGELLRTWLPPPPHKAATSLPVGECPAQEGPCPQCGGPCP